MLVRTVWQGKLTVGYKLVDERSWREDHFQAHRFLGIGEGEIQVGLFCRETSQFGSWSTAIRFDLIAAWRIYELLKDIKTIYRRYQRQTSLDELARLVMMSPRPEDLERCARAFDLLGYELRDKLTRSHGHWPEQDTLARALLKMPWGVQAGTARIVQQRVQRGGLVLTPLLRSAVETIELAQRSKAEQVLLEDHLITTGLPAAESLGVLLQDLGVTQVFNSARTTAQDPGQTPEFLATDEVDRAFMRLLIGSAADRTSIPVVGVMPPGTYSGQHFQPQLKLGKRGLVIRAARFDRVTQRFVLEVVPANQRLADPQLISITEIRTMIGQDMGQIGPLRPGQRAPWLDK